MSFFKANKDPEAVVENTGGSNYIVKSGMYDVSVMGAFVDTNDKGARTINLYLNYNGVEQPFFGAFRLDNNDGSPNFEQDMFNKFLIVCGIEELSEPEEGVLPVGKGKTEREVYVIPELEEIPVTLRVAMEYNLYNGDIKQRKKIKGVYRAEDKATASEIINDKEPGNQYEKDLKYAEKDIYRDGLTEEDIKEWKDANFGSGSSKTEEKSTKKPSFAKKGSKFSMK